MDLLFKLFIGALILLAVVAGCRRKKPNTSTLSGWLEVNYPGRFTVMSTEISDPVRNLSFQVKNSVVAENSDTLVQTIVHWDKRQPDLGITKSGIDSAFVKAARETKDARALLDALHNAGFEHIAAGIYRGTASVMLYEEPTPVRRKECLAGIAQALSNWPALSEYDLEISFQEPYNDGVEFKGVAPVSYLAQSGSLPLKQKIFILNCQQPFTFDAKKSEKEWLFNTNSQRMDAFIEQARQAAEAWRDQHVKNATILSISEYSHPEPNDTHVNLKFFINFKKHSTDPDQADGAISCDVNVDTKTVEQIKQVKE